VASRSPSHEETAAAKAEEEDTMSDAGSAPALPPERVDPETTRLLVIDVQNDFCAEKGWMARNGADVSLIHQAVDRLAAFIDDARSVGLATIFIRAIYDKMYLSEPMLERHARTGLAIEHCQTGTWGAEFFRVAPRDDELVFIKHRYSAFKDTELGAVLRAQNVKNLIVAGITSNVCVESTARDAYMMDYHVVFLSDGSATYDARAHEATLANIRRAFGIVASSEEITAAWRASGRPVEHRAAANIG
jgi:ureidoacrylate peracid hydrolase